jgi:hypothetical protein
MWTGAGARLLVERLDLLWTRGGPVPPPSDRLEFRPVDDDTLVDLVARCGNAAPCSRLRVCRRLDRPVSVLPG